MGQDSRHSLVGSSAQSHRLPTRCCLGLGTNSGLTGGSRSIELMAPGFFQNSRSGCCYGSLTSFIPDVYIFSSKAHLIRSGPLGSSPFAEVSHLVPTLIISAESPQLCLLTTWSQGDIPAQALPTLRARRWHRMCTPRGRNLGVILEFCPPQLVLIRPYCHPVF